MPDTENKQPDHYIATLNNDGTTTVQDLTPVTGEDGEPYSALQAVKHAMASEPLEFENAIKAQLADRLQTAVEKRREEVAQSIFGVENPEVETPDDNAENIVPEEDKVDDNQPEE